MKGFFALSLPLQIHFLKKHSKIGDKMMTERPSIVKAVTKQQAVPHLWALSTGVRAQQGSEEPPLVPPAWVFSGWNFRLFTKKQLKDKTDRNSSSWLRWEFIQWQAFMVTGALSGLCFSLREKQFPHEGFFFFFKYFQCFNFFLDIASLLSSREAQREV